MKKFTYTVLHVYFGWWPEDLKSWQLLQSLVFHLQWHRGVQLSWLHWWYVLHHYQKSRTFKPVNNCQRYIMLHWTTIKSKMAAVIAPSERKRVSTPNTPNIDESISSPQIEFVDSCECLPWLHQDLRECMRKWIVNRTMEAVFCDVSKSYVSHIEDSWVQNISFFIHFLTRICRHFDRIAHAWLPFCPSFLAITNRQQPQSSPSPPYWRSL